MTSLRRILTGVTLAIAASGLASASTVIGYTASFPVSGIAQNTDFAYTLTLPQFNNMGGTLTLQSVSIYFFATETVSGLTVKSNSTAVVSDDLGFFTNVDCGTALLSPCTGANRQTNSANALDRDGNVVDLINFDTGAITLGPGVGTGAAPACSGTVASSTCSSVTYAPPAMTDSNILEGGPVGTGVSGLVGIVIGSSSPGSYLGTGTWTLMGGTQSKTTDTGGGGNLQIQQTTTALMEAEVDYTYAPSGAPEPTTMVLFGSALVGLGLLRKRVRG